MIKRREVTTCAICVEDAGVEPYRERLEPGGPVFTLCYRCMTESAGGTHLAELDAYRETANTTEVRRSFRRRAGRKPQRAPATQGAKP